MDLSPLSEEMNVAKALERLCGDETLLLDLLKTLVRECREAENKLVMCVDQQNFAELEAQAHYYRGIAANLELTQLQDSAMALEQNTRLGNPEGCRQAVVTLLACSQRIELLMGKLHGNPTD